MRRRDLFTTPFVLTAACGGARREPAPAPVPPPIVVTAPPDAAPVAVFRDPWCFLGDEEIDCPEELLPVADPERLVIARSTGRCWVVIEPGLDLPEDGGRVRCPDGGPTVKLPERTWIVRGDRTIRIDTTTLTCEREYSSNPPGYEAIDRCPAPLLPVLADGVAPLSESAEGCWWHALAVRCPSATVDGLVVELRAKIIDVDTNADGVWIQLGVGTANDVAQGWRGHVRGLKDSAFTIASCTQRTCKALVPVSKQAILASSLEVELGP